jgi:hypothetical protein
MQDRQRRAEFTTTVERDPVFGSDFDWCQLLGWKPLERLGLVALLVNYCDDHQRAPLVRMRRHSSM